MRSGKFYFALIVLTVIAAAVPALANPNPGLDWNTIATDHFEVHFHDGAEWTAQQVASIAEEIFPFITGLYDYDPGITHFVILDTDDYANGAAYFYDNKVEIWATNLEFGLRGTTQWLRNVVTHEYTHIVSIGAAMKMPKRIPAIYLQWINFEDEKRPDVITGYPNAIASYPVVGAVIPPWWAEGTAQYQSPARHYDCWDAHRDMIVRSAVISDEMLTYDEMGFLGHESIGNEMVYDHGYGLVSYIALTYGPEAVEKINEHLGKFNRLTIDGALKEVTGKDGRTLYHDWEHYLEARYDEQLKPVYANPREGWILNDDGYMTITPTWSADGTRAAFLSNKGSDYAATMLYVCDADGKNVKKIGPASSRGSFSPDGGKIVYGSHVRIDKFGAVVSDLFEYDFESKKAKRLTKGARAAQPAYSPDGKRIICVLNSDGTHRLAEMDASVEKEAGDPRVIFAYKKGTQVYEPTFSSDGSRILFGFFTEGTRDIASVAADGSDFRYELRTKNDERDASWDRDGRRILFSSDRTGIFNVYRLDPDSASVEQLTNVTGGAFTPVMSSEGAIAYSGYSGRGYHISVLDPSSDPVATMPLIDYGVHTGYVYDECAQLREATSAGADALAEVDPAPVADLHESIVPRTESGLTGDDAPTGITEGTPNDRRAFPEPEPDPDEEGEDSPSKETPAQGELERNTVTRGDMSGPGNLESTDYERRYTAFQLYPRAVVWDGVLRLGAFVASNEVLDKQSFFASGSYGMDGGFDALLSFELRRLWPVMYIDFYRLRQKYEDQTTIDDLQYYLDIRYDLWSMDLGLRFELEDTYSLLRRQNISIWYTHSEYSVHIDPEYTDASGARFPDLPVGWKYFVGNEFYFQWDYRGIRRALDSDINPRGGRAITLQAMYANDELFTSGEFEYGFNPSFDNNRFGQYTIDWREFFPLPFGRHTLKLRGKFSYIDNAVDDFFWVYMGGMDGARGYTYYTLGGRAGALASATWRFPIWRQINRQFSWLTFKDIYGGAFFEIANAWNNEGFEVQGYKRTAGYELRLNMGSFYSYPLTIGFTGAYGLDPVWFFNPLFPENSVLYQPRWRYYFTMGFTF